MNPKFTNTCFILGLSFFFLYCDQKKDPAQTSAEQSTVVAPAKSISEKEAVIIGEQPEADTLKGSLKAVATGQVGGVKVVVNYHSPAVRNRVVWGGLVPYEQVWVTGAHSATTLETDGAFRLAGKNIPAGKYALFTIPGKKDWVVILNKNWDQHLADEYSEKEDLIRVPVQAGQVASHQERLRYVISSEGRDKGTLGIQWEKVRLAVPIEK